MDRTIIKNSVLKILFVAWMVLWMIFTLRELVYKGQMKEYIKMAGLSLEGKYQALTGKELYELVKIANDSIPPNATYKFEGLDIGELEARRAVYYMYPRIPSDAEGTDYIIVYKKERFMPQGYMLFRHLDDSRYILKKRGAR